MMPSPPALDKSALRRQLRNQRAALSKAARKTAGSRLVRLALRHRLLQRRHKVGFYMPAKNEIDVLPLLKAALRMGVKCYLPVVPRGALADADRRALWFTALTGKARMLDLSYPGWKKNRYGIPEYQPRNVRRVRSRQLDVLFMPLLGFDFRGWRIGMGGGYYDSSLVHLKHRIYWRRPHLIGVGFSVQEVVSAPNDPWDVPLDGILTEISYRQAMKSP